MSSENTSPLTTCIVGGGNSAHVLIPFLSTLGHRVNLLTRRPNEWADVISCEITDGDTGKLVEAHTGRLNKKSNDPADVIPEADVIVLCMPVCTYRLSLAKLAPMPLARPFGAVMAHSTACSSSEPSPRLRSCAATAIRITLPYMAARAWTSLAD